MKKILFLFLLQTLGLAATEPAMASGENASLIADLNNEVDSRIAAAGNSPGNAVNLFSSFSKESSTYTRNTTVWTGDLDFTGVFAAYHSGSAANYSLAALITPQDLLMVAHVYYPSPNDADLTFDFVDAKNGIHTVAEASSLKLTTPGSDTRVVHLASPLPDSIKVYKLLPPNYTDYCPDHNLSKFPVVIAYAFGVGSGTGPRVLVWDAPSPSSSPMLSGPVFNYALNVFSYTSPISENHKAYTLPTNHGIFEPGSSGSPAFVIVHHEPILVGCVATAPGGTTFVAKLAPQLNEAIATLANARGDKPYKVKTVDLSGFTSY